MSALASIGPSAYWYLARGTGAVALVLLTISLATLSQPCRLQWRQASSSILTRPTRSPSVTAPFDAWRFRLRRCISGSMAWDDLTEEDRQEMVAAPGDRWRPLPVIATSQTVEGDAGEDRASGHHTGALSGAKAVWRAEPPLSEAERRRAALEGWEREVSEGSYGRSACS